MSSPVMLGSVASVLASSLNKTAPATTSHATKATPAQKLLAMRSDSWNPSRNADRSGGSE
eukprot:CAMPEP_0196730352 /NCGR_PEP_ID=MMETSP1091-20130531/10426_1 /TAXON_ID=302021 /ORGANISM="Rhodomonas sp., Strain CCMP768" /LENGTH=59 /DNA_ID=CAMNT_0042073329 /DNA_START=167 /DNA_END=346 /DNA_ORIENTATION=-